MRNGEDVSRQGLSGGVQATPPCIPPEAPPATQPPYLRVIMNDASQSIVNMQGSASSAHIVFIIDPLRISFGAPNVFTVYRKLRRIMAQLLWGGHGTPYFTMDYGLSPFCGLAILHNESSYLFACLRPRRDRCSLAISPLRGESGLQRRPSGPQKHAYSQGKTTILIEANHSG